MPEYTYVCGCCGYVHTDIHPISKHNSDFNPSCPGCGSTMTRDYRADRPRIAQVFQPHFNYAVGKYVNSRREFHDALKSASEERTAQTGIEHNFVPMDLSEAPKAEEARESVYRGEVESGIREAKQWHHS